MPHISATVRWNLSLEARSVVACQTGSARTSKGTETLDRHVAKLTEWLMKHPKTNGLLVALMGVGFVGFLAIRLDDVLGFLPSAARRQEAIFRGILWAAGVSA